LQNYSETTPKTAGEGFWLYPEANGTITIPGQTISQTASSSLILKKGWNLVSSPFQFACKYFYIAENTSSESGLTWAQAVAANTVDSRLWAYDSLQAAYYLTDTLLPWQGCWIWAEKDCALLIRGNEQTNNVKIKKIFSAADETGDLLSSEWNVHFILAFSGGCDALNMAGVRNLASDEKDRFDSIKAPVTPSRQPALMLDSIYSHNFKKNSTALKTWQITAVNLNHGKNIALCWNTETLPSGYTAAIEDTDTGKTTECSASGFVTVNSSGNQKNFIFRAAPDYLYSLLLDKIQFENSTGNIITMVKNNSIIFRHIIPAATENEISMYNINGTLLWKKSFFSSFETTGEETVTSKRLLQGLYFFIIRNKTASGQTVTTRKMTIILKQ